ncbi:hypothetical protein [uncultured Arthrobacter sp.]|uniref:hypothetical protein n=1 Tax=uncultured Arthrobacter sp. TaxID=114050 RepID=UPI002602E879|nr:hypothetical protein [uncultured Arthrobacter sp.]
MATTTPQVVAVSGHSQMYGQGGDGALPGINEQTTAPSTNNAPYSLKAVLDLMYPGLFTLQNKRPLR